jgi:uncharacterized RmlC-like cupin family protein
MARQPRAAPDLRGASKPAAVPDCVLVGSESGHTYEGKQRLRYLDGVSAQSAGSGALCLALLTVPPGGRSAAHLHEAHESAVYVVSGVGEMFHGERLRRRMTFGPGDFVYIPAGAPHVVRNTSASEPLVGVLARTDPNEQESVVLLPELEDAVPAG